MTWTLIQSGNKPVGIIDQSNRRVFTFSGDVKQSDARLAQFAPDLEKRLTELCMYVMDCHIEQTPPNIDAYFVRQASDLLNRL